MVRTDKIILAVAAVGTAVLLLMVPSSSQRVYDCGMADWHPDIPTKVRELCRKRNSLDRISESPLLQ
jgi:hypothetical protein